MLAVCASRGAHVNGGFCRVFSRALRALPSPNRLVHAPSEGACTKAPPFRRPCAWRENTRQNPRSSNQREVNDLISRGGNLETAWPSCVQYNRR